MKYVYSVIVAVLAVATAAYLLFSGTVREEAFIKGGILMNFGAIIGCTTLIILTIKEKNKS